MNFSLFSVDFEWWFNRVGRKFTKSLQKKKNFENELVLSFLFYLNLLRWLTFWKRRVKVIRMRSHLKAISRLSRPKRETCIGQVKTTKRNILPKCFCSDSFYLYRKQVATIHPFYHSALCSLAKKWFSSTKRNEFSKKKAWPMAGNTSFIID